MDWLKKLISRDGTAEEVDYYAEGLELLRAGKYHEALTSFRLALRDAPNDTAVLQQIAITYTRIGMTDEAMKTYRTALQKDAAAVGAHYGMAFLKLRAGQQAEAIDHLRAFLSAPPAGPDAMAHVGHARKTLAELVGETSPEDAGVDGRPGDPGADRGPDL